MKAEMTAWFSKCARLRHDVFWNFK